jgi:hypothetical protein
MDDALKFGGQLKEAEKKNSELEKVIADPAW